MNTCFQDAACRHYHHFLIVVIIIIISCSLESRRKRHDRCWVCSVKAYRPMVRRSAEAHGGRGRADARLRDAGAPPPRAGGALLPSQKWQRFSRTLNAAANVDGCPVLAAKTV